jgi:DNA replication protein DnaC
MLTHPTLDKLHTLRLTGMAKAFEEQLRTPGIEDLSGEERLGLLVDRELAWRETRRLATRLRNAKLRHGASIEDIDYRYPRGLDRGLLTKLTSCQWLREHHNLLITGPTGIGKSWLACALADKACREGFSVLYVRAPRWLQELIVAKGDGRYSKLLAQLAKTDLVVLDDFGGAVLNEESRRDLLEFLEDRYEVRSTLITSQLPVEHWHEAIGHPALADAILDRLVHNAYRLNLKGDSMRRQRAPLTSRELSEA